MNRTAPKRRFQFTLLNLAGALTLFAVGSSLSRASEIEACESDATKFFKGVHRNSVIYACDNEEKLQFCHLDQPQSNCSRVDLRKALNTVDSKFNKLNFPSQRTFLALKNHQSANKSLLAAHLELMKFRGGIVIGREISIQTGPYAQITLGTEAINSRCMAAIMLTAYRLNQHFPNYNFVVDSHIQNCQNLRDGLRQLIAHQRRVKSNLDRFNSPLHSVYLTNKTKFNHFMLGEMGLYVNVDKPGEIKRRLVDYEIGVHAIRHESPPTHRVTAAQ